MVSATVVSSKRKRNQVSYAVDDYYDALNIEDQVSNGNENDDFAIPRKRKSGKRARTDSKANHDKPFRFLDLPTELRDEIYALTLTDPHGVTLISKIFKNRHTVERGYIEFADGARYRGNRHDRMSGRMYTSDPTFDIIGSRSRSFVPTLLATNRQIRHEGSTFLYKQKIVFASTETLCTFIMQIGSFNSLRVADLTITSWPNKGTMKGYNFAGLSALAPCVKLKSLLIDCSVGLRYGQPPPPARLARQIFREGHLFMEAFGAANGHFDAAVEVIKLCNWHFNRNSGLPTTVFEFDQEKEDTYKNELRRYLRG